MLKDSEEVIAPDYENRRANSKKIPQAGSPHRVGRRCTHKGVFLMLYRAAALVTIVASIATVASAQTTQPADKIDALFINGTLADAEAKLDKMLKADPKDDHARFALGTAQFLGGVESLLGSLGDYGFPRLNAGMAMFVGTPIFGRNAEPKVVTDLSRQLQSLQVGTREVISWKSHDGTMS